MTSKAPDAFRTISEVGEDLGLPQHVLRFWETRFPAIRPLKRGGGRRYYRPDDVDLLKGIQALLYGQGYTIKGVQRIIKETGPRAVGAIGRGEAAALPPRQEQDLVEDADDDASDNGPEPRRDLGRAVPLHARTADRLRTILDDLTECRRILRALRADRDA